MSDLPGGAVRPPMFEDEGALYVGKGKFLLSISGNKDERRISTRMQTILIIVAILVVAVVLVVATVLSGHQANSLPYQWTLNRCFGNQMEQVCMELDLQLSDWTKSGEGEYTLNEPCEMSNISFALRLYFDENGKMERYEYLADYKADSDKAAADLYKVAIDLRLGSYQSEGADDETFTRMNLKKRFRQEKDLMVTAVGVSDKESAANVSVKAYLEAVEAEADYPGLLHGYVVRPAMIYNDIRVGYTSKNDSVLIHISCQVEPEREK